MHDEIVEVKWIVMQHDSAGISYNLNKETTDHADGESPSLVLNVEPELHDQKQAKSSSIDGIASKRGYIFHPSAAEGTFPTVQLTVLRREQESGILAVIRKDEIYIVE